MVDLRKRRERPVPMHNPMHWNPDQDIVPFRPEDSVAWRVEAVRRDLVQLHADHLEMENQGPDWSTVGLDPVITGSSFTVDFPVDAGMAAWFERLMDSMLRPPEPTPGTFLASAIEQAARQDPEVPGIQSWRPRTDHDAVNVRTDDPGSTFLDRLREDAGRLLERPTGFQQSMFSPQEWAAMLAQTRADYERTTGLRWNATPGDDTRTVLSVDPAADDPASGATAWIIPLDAEGNPTGTPRSLSCEIGSLSWEAETDVRGGHM